MPLKSLKPSMRKNKRYLLVRGKNLKENIEKAILEFIGILGMSKTDLRFIKIGKDFTIISVNREMVDSVRSSFAVFSERITVEKVSGTLNGLGKKWNYPLSSIKYFIVLSGSLLPLKYSSTGIKFAIPALNFPSS